MGRRVCREVTCVCGLSKHPGSFHRDVAFPARADLAEFDCSGRHPSSEGEGFCHPPFLSPLLSVSPCRADPERIWDPWGPYLSPRLGTAHRHLPSRCPGCSSTRPAWCSGPEDWNRAAGPFAQSSIPCGWGLGGVPLAGPQGSCDLFAIEAPYYCPFMAPWGTLALEFILKFNHLYSALQCAKCFHCLA